MNIVFTPTAWEQYTEWQREDKKMVKRINELVKDIDRNGLLNGIGKPEPLKHRKAFSRRITDEHRLVYNVDSNQNLIIYSCKYHYEDKYYRVIMTAVEIVSIFIGILTLLVTFGSLIVAFLAFLTRDRIHKN
ncbi:MAG: Txe/YoeB family addiction module toxin [Lachnospira sp.]|nr:Txe/YoeB family addiction module toxin [Lachnospira sp.]